MTVDNKWRKGVIIFLYVISLMTLFLPWCYFDQDIDGIQYGKDMVNGIGMVILVGVTLGGLVFAKTKNQKRITIVLLLMHPIIYISYFLFWYIPFITDFNLKVSIEAGHYGIYLAILSSIAVFLIYMKGEYWHEGNK